MDNPKTKFKGSKMCPPCESNAYSILYLTFWIHVVCQIGKSPIIITVGTLNINKVVGKYMLDEFIQVDNAIASASPVVFCYWISRKNQVWNGPLQIKALIGGLQITNVDRHPSAAKLIVTLKTLVLHFLDLTFCWVTAWLGIIMSYET